LLNRAREQAVVDNYAKENKFPKFARTFLGRALSLREAPSPTSASYARPPFPLNSHPASSELP